MPPQPNLQLHPFPSHCLPLQKSWIGRSEGAEINFKLVASGALSDSGDEVIKVFTTRPDTLNGVSYVVLAPEHPLSAKIAASSAAGAPGVAEYIAASTHKSELDRTVGKEKSGVDTMLCVTHPLTGEELQLWVADYVLAGYGTGAVMAVPAHDERDFEFATRFELPIKRVVAPVGVKVNVDYGALPMCEPGVCTNSGEGLDGLTTDKCKRVVIDKLEAMGAGAGKVSYKLRDWGFSRQRYWGEPIPIYFPVEVAEGEDPRAGAAYVIDYDSPQVVDESELPIELPDLEDFTPGDDPQGCLARCLDWRFFKRDGRWWARETNTMPQWAGSCWYYLRFCDPANAEAAWSPQAELDWMPVDLYVGGAEHAVLHLLYARFWHKVLPLPAAKFLPRFDSFIQLTSLPSHPDLPRTAGATLARSR